MTKGGLFFKKESHFLIINGTDPITANVAFMEHRGHKRARVAAPEVSVGNEGW